MSHPTLLDNIVDNLPTAVQLKNVKDNYRIVMWNKAAETMYGVPRALAIGRNVHDLWPKAEADRMHAADLHLIAAGGVQEAHDRVAPTMRGDPIRVHMRKVALHDASGEPTHLLVIADDMSAQIAAEGALRDSEARFRSLYELSSDWYWEQDTQFRGTMRTHGALTPSAPAGQFFGHRRWEDANVSPVNGTWDDHIALLDAHQPFRNFEIRVVADDGSLSYRSLSGEPMYGGGDVFAGYRGIGRDITAQKLAEDSLRRGNAELVELNTRLSRTQEQLVQSEKLASIGQLAAGVAHEINNPIGYVFSNFTTLEGYLSDLFAVLSAYQAAEPMCSSPETLARLMALRERVELDFLKTDIPVLIAESKEGIARVKTIVQNLKDFSRVDDTQQWQSFDLRKCIESTLKMVNNEIKYKADVVLSLEPATEIDCLPSQLNQVILNLLVNAAHAIGPERGTITVRSGSAERNAWFSVADSGCGMSRDVQLRIFDPFFTTKPVGEGTGLGLSLSYGIVQKHHGRIEVDSTPGNGTTFTVTLPIRQRTATADAPVVADLALLANAARASARELESHIRS
ncbi:MAG: ATP-binding protein [Betaproteobacteria bacterium]